MLSFSDAGFLMGLATSGGGEGLVSCHAYSVLEVLEVHNSVVGEQPKMTSFFQTAKRQKLSTESQFHKESNDEDDDEVIVVDGPEARHVPCSRGKGERETIRLVRIRNPWGKKEWTGGWSASSEKWTRSLRSKLDGKSYAKGDGTFFMSFQDMLQRFSTLDVAKCHEVSYALHLRPSSIRCVVCKPCSGIFLQLSGIGIQRDGCTNRTKIHF
jgi:calpain-15